MLEIQQCNMTKRKEITMRILISLLIAMTLVFGTVTSPVFDGGGKVQGENAKSDSFGGSVEGANVDAPSPGIDA